MQLVTFDLLHETYGLEIDCIQEIIMDQTINRIPNLPPFLKGVINLRGTIIPVVEGVERVGYSSDQAPGEKEGRIIIIEHEDQLIGLRVYTTHSVLQVEKESIRSSPKMVEEMGGQFIRGVIEIDNSDAKTESSVRGQYSRTELEEGLTSAPAERDKDQQEQSSGPDDQSTKTIFLMDLNELFSSEDIEVLETAAEIEEEEI